MVLHSYVLLVLAGVLMELTLVAVVLSIAAAHRLLRLALAAEGAHAFGRQAIWRLDTRAAVAAGHLGAGVFQRCREGRTLKRGLVKGCHFYCTLESNRDDRPPYLSGCWCTLGGSVQQQLFWAWRSTWHPWVRAHCSGCLLVQTSCVSFSAWIDSGTLHAPHILYCYAGACFNCHVWKATLWIFTFPTNDTRRVERNRREVCFPPWICFYSN